ncbi:MAG: hypothetical protein K2X77_03860 [Candidatus Obscuribacterales bacterium]|nr:hypothetical protein [Candidatus Obscuribacterales bacterium]
MGPELTGFLVIAGVAVAAAMKPSKKRESLVFAARCRAPKAVVMQSLENFVSVTPARSSASVYPFNQYWLQLADSDYKRGTISAIFEYMETYSEASFFGFKLRVPSGRLQRLGFIWVIEEVLLPTQAELAVSLFCQPLENCGQSPLDEQVIHYMATQTREAVFRLDELALRAEAAQKKTMQLPPVSTHKSNIPPPVGPPPASSSASLVAPVPPPSAGVSTLHSSAARSSAPKPGSQMGQAFSALQKKSSSSSLIGQNVRKIDWPSPQDFHEVLQNPQHCFEDRDLRNGLAETDSLGMPRVASGAFASVYRFHCIGRDRAVRCFLQPIKDREDRYKLIGEALGNSDWTAIAQFDYLPKGILLRAKWYPVLKMEWIDGIPLNTHISDLCRNGDTEALERLRQDFAIILQELREKRIAHGDLQHGNIIVRDGKMVLIDYDGMFVPGLENKGSAEIGHPNYQHPARDHYFYNEHMDNFSAWIISSALLCLREDPGLWPRTYDDGESLLFHRRDFLAPNNSELLDRLAHHGSKVVRDRATFLRHLFASSLENVPFPFDASPSPIRVGANKRFGNVLSLDDEREEQEKPEPPEQKSTGDNSRPAIPDWLSDSDHL